MEILQNVDYSIITMTTYLDTPKVDLHHLLQCLHDITMGLSLLVCQEGSEEEEVGLLPNGGLHLSQEVQLLLCLPQLPLQYLTVDDACQGWDTGLIQVEGLLVGLKGLLHLGPEEQLVG